MCRSLSLSNLLALASAAAFAVGCNGEQAFSARDASALLTGAGGDAGSGAVTGGGTGSGGTAITGTGGQTGAGGQAGAAGGHAGAMGGMGGMAGMGVGGMAGGRPVGPGNPGESCQVDGDCMSSYCVDHVCCKTACTGICQTCAGATLTQPGTCGPADTDTDPRGNCTPDASNFCGKVGKCDGAGVCKVQPYNTACGTAQMCDATMSGVIPGQICDGKGVCVNAPSNSCNGFLCSSAQCGTTCTDDTGCASTGFCSESNCIATANQNLAGNGDLETDTLTGWQAENGGPALALTPTSHSGQYGLVEQNRGAYFQGPGYNLPTGLGQYAISFWAMQNQDNTFQGVPQLRMSCYSGVSYVQVLASFSIDMSLGTWVHINATVDTSTSPYTGADCFPDKPASTTPARNGLVRSMFVYLNQPNTDPSQQGYFIPDGPKLTPDLYVDDLVVSVPDGHNLIGNPNFESGVADGWSASAGAPLPAVQTTVTHGGAFSLGQTGRLNPTDGIKYTLPTGAGRYRVSYWVMQTGTKSHPLVIQPSYTCTGSSSPATPAPAPIAVTANSGNVDANTWVQITGTVVLPPPSESPTCVLSQASLTLQQGEAGACSTIECPSLYLDDAMIKLQ